jgi:diguanylate cyclase (GGDEF)-like protein
VTARRLPAWILAALLMAASPFAHGAAPASIDALLAQADAQRSTDPAHFHALLDQLQARRAQATPAQLLRLRYLEAYRLGYEGKYADAIAAATALFRGAPDPEIRYRAGILATNLYAATRDFVAGLHQLEDTLALGGKVGNAQLRHQGLTVAGVLYNQLGQFERARQSAEQVLADAPDARDRCTAGQVRIEALASLGHAPAEDEPFDAVIAQCTQLGEAVVANMVRGELARKWAAEGKGATAIGVLEVHLPEVRATAYPRLIAEIESLLAELHLARHDAAKAQAYAQAAVDDSGATHSSLPVVVAHRILYQVALDRGDYKAALEQYRQYAEADKAYLDDAKARELAVQTVRQQTREKTQAIELLNRQNKVLRLQEDVARKEAGNNLLLAALLAGLLASIAYWAYKVKRVQLSFRHLAETDALTGISNRHHFTKLVEAALAHCARSDAELGFVMFDLDNFKAINDRYGHAAGDWVLRKVAETCRALCRKDDHLSRIGGEEFAILLLDCELDAAEKMARTCCERVAAIDTSPSGHAFTISASFGVTSAGLAGNDFSRLLAQADQAMYRAKSEGRNRVVVHTLAPRVPGEAAPL